MTAQKHDIPRTRLICNGCLVALKNNEGGELWEGYTQYELKRDAQKHDWETAPHQAGGDFCPDCRERPDEVADRKKKSMWGWEVSDEVKDRRAERRKLVARERRKAAKEEKLREASGAEGALKVEPGLPRKHIGVNDLP